MSRRGTYGTCAAMKCEAESVTLRTCVTLGLLVEIPLCAEHDAEEQAFLVKRAAKSGIAVVDSESQ